VRSDLIWLMIRSLGRDSGSSRRTRDLTRRMPVRDNLTLHNIPRILPSVNASQFVGKIHPTHAPHPPAMDPSQNRWDYSAIGQENYIQLSHHLHSRNLTLNGESSNVAQSPGAWDCVSPRTDGGVQLHRSSGLWSTFAGTFCLACISQRVRGTGTPSVLGETTGSDGLGWTVFPGEEAACVRQIYSLRECTRQGIVCDELDSKATTHRN